MVAGRFEISDVDWSDVLAVRRRIWNSKPSCLSFESRPLGKRSYFLILFILFGGDGRTRGGAANLHLSRSAAFFLFGCSFRGIFLVSFSSCRGRSVVDLCLFMVLIRLVFSPTLDSYMVTSRLAFCLYVCIPCLVIMLCDIICFFLEYYFHSWMRRTHDSSSNTLSVHDKRHNWNMQIVSYYRKCPCHGGPLGYLISWCCCWFVVL